jgi:anti-sigma regulatory factor (Ser/Thr protein kinase)
VLPPYLFDRHDPGRGDGVGVSLDVDASVITLSVHGTWGRALRRDVTTAIHKCLSEHPAALILDLHGLDDSHSVSPATWITGRRMGAEMTPPVQVLVCVRDDSPLAARLRRLGAARFLPAFPTLAQARTGAAQRIPLTSRVVLRLAPDGDAAGRARHLVTDACTAWQLPELIARGRLVTSELVANAVDHARTPITVVLSRREGGLHLVVRDDDPQLPRFACSPPLPAPQPNGQGLLTVHAAASLWGAMPTADGKAVWAIIRSWTRRSGGA